MYFEIKEKMKISKWLKVKDAQATDTQEPEVQVEGTTEEAVPAENTEETPQE